MIPRHIFQKLERRHKTGRSSRKFAFKEQFTTMAFIQLAARRSMRDGMRYLEAGGSRLYHWGLKAVARSTFADANNSRPMEFFSNMCTSSEIDLSASHDPLSTEFSPKAGQYHVPEASSTLWLLPQQCGSKALQGFAPALGRGLLHLLGYRAD